MKTRTVMLGALALTSALALTGCGSAATNSNGASSSADAGATATFNDADVMFATMMIPHHEQAIEMSDIVLAKPDLDSEVTELAEAIKAAQGPEIEQLQGWLDAWGTDTRGSGHDAHSMDGMMTDEDLAALEAAPGPEASSLFLEQMIVHHDGAVDMARTQLEDGKNTDALALAQEIIDAQTTEIQQMREILDRL